MRQYPGFRRSLLKARKSSTSTIAFTTALTIGINSGHAQTVIESSNQSQTLSTDTAYVVNVGTEVSDKKDDAIIVNGIAPVTVTNAGTLVGGQKVFVERKQEPAAGIRFNVDGSLINQASGVIVGDDRGVFMNSAGTINNITNFGEITGSKGPAIEYGPNSSGTIDKVVKK